MADGSVRIDITADDSDIKKKLDGVEDAAEDAADSLDDLGDSSEKSGKGFDIMDIAAGNLVSNGLSALVSGLGEAISSLLNLAEETREFREDMAKLQTAFTSTGHGAEDAKKVYEDFYAILGESDRSVEAVNHLAELTSNTEELSKWSTIAAGVTAKFGDSLPIEGLTEAANETAKVGQVTGVVADALNWAGISEDKFNESLKKCTTEQQRATLITNTLNDLYSEAAGEYNELTASTQEARRATAQMEAAQAELGAKLEPVTTAWTTLKAQGLEAIMPAVDVLASGLLRLTNNLMGNKTAAEERAASAMTALETVRAEAEAYRELKTAQFEQSAGELAHIENAKLLHSELEGLVDANGRVDEANRGRAEFIVSTLNEALGLELSMVGNQIQNYNNLKTAVEAAISAKQAEILLANDLEAYTEALENRTAKEQEQAQKLIEISDQRKKVMDAENEYHSAQAALVEATANAKTEADLRNLESLGRAVRSKELEWQKEAGALSNLETAYNENEELLQTYYKDISSYQEAQALIMQGKTAEAIELLNNKNSAFIDSSKIIGEATEEQKRQLEAQAIATGVNAALMKERYESGVEGVTEEMVKTAEKAAETAKTEFEKIGGQIGDGIGKGAEDKKPGLLTKIKNIVSAMKKAAKEEADINSPSKEFEWIAEMIMEGLSVGIVENTNYVVGNMRNVVKELLATMKDGAKKSVEEIEAEIKATEEAREKAFKAEIKAKEKEIEALDDIRTEKNKKTIDAQKKTLQKELKLLKEQQEGEREALADKKKNLQEELTIAKEKEKAINTFASNFEKQMDKFTTLEEKYAEDSKKLFENLDRDIQAAENSYTSAFENRVKALKSELNLFKLVEKGDKVKGRELTNALQSQVNVLKNYDNILAKLSEKNINPALLEELKGFGIDALPELEALNKMSDKELEKYVALWEEKSSLAESVATKELSGLREETDKTIEELAKTAEKDAQALFLAYTNNIFAITKEMSEGMLEAGDAGIEALGEKISGYVEMGEALMDGVTEGLTNGRERLVHTLVSNVLSAIQAAKDAADIHSPSGLTEGAIGEPLAMGVVKGWKNKVSTMNKSFSSGISDALASLRATVAAENSRFGTTAGATDTGFFDLAQAVGTQTAGINSLASEYRKGSVNMRPIIIELDRRELGRAVVDVSGSETVRIGSKISLGGAY